MGTSVSQEFPWGTFVTATVLCSDGIVRNVSRIANTADTFFSIPAAVKVKGRTVSGYVTMETLTGSSIASPTASDDPTCVKFVAYTYGKNADALPEGTYTVPATETATETSGIVGGAE